MVDHKGQQADRNVEIAAAAVHGRSQQRGTKYPSLQTSLHGVADDVFRHPFALAVAEVEALHAVVRVAFEEHLLHGPAKNKRRRNMVQDFGALAHGEPNDLVGSADVGVAHGLVVEQVIHQRGIVVDGVNVVRECAPCRVAEAHVCCRQVAAYRPHPAFPSLGALCAVRRDGLEPVPDPLHRTTVVRADEHVDVVGALRQQAREKKRTKETCSTREQHTSVRRRGGHRRRKRAGIEAHARVSAHHRSFNRLVLATKIGKRARQAQPCVRSRCEDLREQIEQLADGNLFQHAQIDRPRQVVLTFLCELRFERHREFHQLQGIESGFGQRPRLGAAQPESAKQGLWPLAVDMFRVESRVNLADHPQLTREPSLPHEMADDLARAGLGNRAPLNEDERRRADT